MSQHEIAMQIRNTLEGIGITDDATIANAIALAFVQAVTASPASAYTTPKASTREEAVKKDALSIAAEKQRARKQAQKESAPVLVEGTVARKGLSYKLVDKVANVKKQCVMPTCRKLRKGRSRFCPVHTKANFAHKCETGNSIDD
jgi:hypothetical protein